MKTYSVAELKRALFTIGLIAKHFDFADIAVETSDVCIVFGLRIEKLCGNGNGINLQKTYGFPDLTVIQLLANVNSSSRSLYVVVRPSVVCHL